MPLVGGASRHVFEEVRAGLVDLQAGVEALAQEVIEEEEGMKLRPSSPGSPPVCGAESAVPSSPSELPECGTAEAAHGGMAALGACIKTAKQKRDALRVFQEQAQSTVEALERRLAAVQAAFRGTVTFYGQTLVEADLTSQEPARFFGILWHVVTSIQSALKQRVKLRTCLEPSPEEAEGASAQPL